MSKHRPSSSYGQSVRKIAYDHYRLGWTVDFYYRNSNLRWPRHFSRDTDEKGAEKFAKRWGVKIK